MVSAPARLVLMASFGNPSAFTIIGCHIKRQKEHNDAQIVFDIWQCFGIGTQKAGYLRKKQRCGQGSQKTDGGDGHSTDRKYAI